MSKQPTPILSSRADDPELRDEIDRFVIGLAEQIDLVQDALCAADFATLTTRCTRLAQDADRLGYSTLADAARATADASTHGKRDPAEDGVVEITQIGQRVRLGHRGAA